MSEIKITTTLYDVEVALDTDEVLNEMDTEDLVSYIKDNCSVREILDNVDDEAIVEYLKDHSNADDVLGAFDNTDLLEHLCEGGTNVEVAEAALNGVDPAQIKALFAKLVPEAAAPRAPEVTLVAAGDEAVPSVFWVKVDGVTRCMLAGTTVYSKHGRSEGHDKAQAEQLARALALGMHDAAR